MNGANFPLPEGLWPSLSFTVLVLAILSTMLILWRRYFSRRMLMQRISELETLGAAGRALVASELDVNALCELIAQEAGKVIDNRTFQVGLFENQFYQVMFRTVDGQRQPTPQSFDIGDGEGLVNWLRHSQRPLLVRDFERERSTLPAQPRYVSPAPPRSALYVPLVSGETTVGIIAAQSSKPDRFSEEDKRRLTILANQAAAAVANARLYEAERTRAAHLELVGQIARQVNAVQDLEEIFEQVVTLTKETFGFYPVNIFSHDPQTGDAVLRASSEQGVAVPGARLEASRGIVGAAMAAEDTIVCNNTTDDPRFVATLHAFPGDIARHTLAEIAIPLIVDERVLGVLDVQSPVIGAFTEAEQTVLEALAAEVASALYKARQLAWQQSQAWISTAQLQVAEAISRSRDLEEILAAITRLAPMLVGVSCCGILLWDEELQLYQGAALYRSEEGAAADFTSLRLPLGRWGALDAVHVGQESLSTHSSPPSLQPFLGPAIEANKTLQLLPLVVSGRPRNEGVMLVNQLPAQSNEREWRQPDERRQELLENIAQQTAQALQSARLRQAQQEEAWVNTALLQVAEAVNSLIDLNEILDTIVRLVPMLVGVESAVILIRDAERGLFVPGPSYGISHMGRGLLATLEIEDYEFHDLTSSRTISRLPSDSVYSLRLPAWLETVLETSSAYAFALNAQGRLVGAMLIGAAEETDRPLSMRRLNILNGIAQQAATAVVNNQLYKESADRARLQQELSVAHDIQASFLPEGNPDIPGCDVASLWLAAQQVSGDFYDFLPRSDGTWGIVIADVAGKGVPAALFMALCRTILRTVGFSRKDPADVLMRVNEIINSDASTDLFVTVCYAIWDPQKKAILYANGGHNPPLLLRAKGESTILQAPGIALGVLPDIDITSHTVQLAAGDTVIFYTDGVTEAINEDFDEYGLERLHLAARTARRRTAEQIVESIKSSVHDHAGDTSQFDDLTLVVLKRR